MRVFLAILMIVALIGIACHAAVYAEQTQIEDCGPWVNCNHNPPNFNGTCCRICFFPKLGYRDWYCAVHTDDIGFTDEEIFNLKGHYLYNGVNNDIRELLIMELNSKRND